MKKKEFKLRSMTDIKVFLLFLLDNIGHPIDHSSLITIVAENTDEIIYDYDECLRDLADSGHVLFDEIDGEKYYMISETGRIVSSELYDSLDKEFRERSLRSAIKYISLSRSGARISTSITETEEHRFEVKLEAVDSLGKVMSLSLAVKSRSEAEKIRRNFETKPDMVYRGILFSATGRIEYLS